MSKSVVHLSVNDKLQNLTFAEIVDRLDTLESRLSAIENRTIPASIDEPVWFDLKRACQKKGISYNSLTTRAYAWRRPNGGKPDAILNNRMYWKKKTVEKWCEMDDAQLRRLYHT